MTIKDKFDELRSRVLNSYTAYIDAQCAIADGIDKVDFDVVAEKKLVWEENVAAFQSFMKQVQRNPQLLG